MRKFLILTILTLLASVDTLAQRNEDPYCPPIYVNGPAGLTPPGGLATFTTTIGDQARNYNPQYRWTVSTGKIVGGQGTLSIRVKMPEDVQGITASVEVLGLPEGCPAMASGETPSGDRPPAELIAALSSVNEIDLGTLDSIEKSVQANPNSQVFVIAVFERTTAKTKTVETLNRLREILTSTQQIESDRITFLTGFADKGRVKIYLVPPGADNPDCKNCEEFKNFVKDDCPIITVSGPAGITNPGKIAIFAAEISGNAPPNVVYVWTVSEGAIVSGQNTLSVQVRYPKTGASNLSATLIVRGLPESCSSEFSVAAPFVIDSSPVLIDEYGAITPQNEHAHLKAAVAQLKRNPNSMLWIIFYPTGSDASIKRKEKSLSDYLTKIQHIGELFKIVVGPNIGLEKIKILIIPPGVENPQP